MKYAPFVVPTLCRSEHFIKLMESLKKNSWACYTDVIVSVDFPPSEKYRKGWQEICDYLDNGDFSVFNKLIVIKQPKNIGAGANGLFLQRYIEQHQYGKWIRSDDDCVFSPCFLEYMNKCLDAYEDDPDVVGVTGYSYPIQWSSSEGATCFKQQFNVATWGLGRWVKKCDLFEDYVRSGKMLDDAQMVIRTGRHKKMLSRCYVQYFNQAASDRNGMVKGFMIRMTDIALRAYLACQDKYCITPIHSLVRNNGFDGSGLYCHKPNVVDNTKAGTYDYQNQPIDESEHFDIVLNDPKLLEENRRKLDKFDKVSGIVILYTKFKVFIIRCFGVTFARNLDRISVSVLKALKLKK